MSPQKQVWNSEYQKSAFITKGHKPQKKLLRYFRYHKFHTGIEFKDWRVLDLGCGTGRNSNFLAVQGAKVSALDIAPEAIRIAKERAKGAGVEVDYREKSIGEVLPYQDNEFNLILDITASNALNDQERATYLAEANRVLCDDGAFIVRALCKDKDKNAKYLLKHNPGPEEDTYIMPKTGIIERVFSEQDFRKYYGKFFKIKKLEKTSGYTRFENQPYKRNYLIAYMKKRAE